ncbi:MAG: carboxypeptidase-like regulatory domain-containing protein [Bacteroidales bacterium]|nr:carboxypeptidase-like regulatory domain-containing protein [Bacteroidales bacterium]
MRRRGSPPRYRQFRDAVAGWQHSGKGTIDGAITDADGHYALTVAGSSSVLTFSFIGYTSQDVTVGSQDEVNVVLQESLSALDEIVVVGYSTWQGSPLQDPCRRLVQPPYQRVPPPTRSPVFRVRWR